MLHPCAAAAAPSAIVLLREATGDQHQHLERLNGLLQPLTLARYTRIVQGFDAFLSAWEPLLAQALPGRLRQAATGRFRGEAARRDLAALSALRLPVAVPGLVLATPAAALGSQYVLEGSALGAQVIAPVLWRDLGLDAGNGAAYFGGRGADTAAGWRDFRQTLEQELPAEGPARTQACAAAVATFEALATHFRRILVEPATA